MVYFLILTAFEVVLLVIIYPSRLSPLSFENCSFVTNYMLKNCKNAKYIQNSSKKSNLYGGKLHKIGVMYHVKYFHIKAIPYMYYLSKINLKLHFSKLNYYEKFGAKYMSDLQNGEKLYYINLED